MAGNGSPLDVARQVESTMQRTSKALQAATRAALADAGKVAKRELDTRAAQVPGPDRRFSNMRRYNHGGRLAVRTKSIDGGGAMLVSPIGPWKLAETGAAPHRVNHPGTRQGRRSWTLGQESAFDHLGRKVPEDIGEAVEEAFSG